MSDKLCTVMDCPNNTDKQWQLVCDEHWEQLPAGLRSDLYYEYKTNPDGQRHNELVVAALELLEKDAQTTDSDNSDE